MGKCKDCKWWIFILKEDSNAMVGIDEKGCAVWRNDWGNLGAGCCKRYPNEKRTYEVDFCGEFKAKSNV